MTQLYFLNIGSEMNTYETSCVFYMQFQLKLQDEDIPSIVGNPIKCLGKWCDDSLQDVNNSKCLEQQGSEGLSNIDKSGLPGKYKTWMFQHGLMPRLTLPLMLYEVTLSTVEKMERQINRHLRRWLGIPQCFSSVGLYSRTSKLQLPLSSIVAEFKTGKARLIVTLKDSRDERAEEGSK